MEGQSTGTNWDIIKNCNVMVDNFDEDSAPFDDDGIWSTLIVIVVNDD